MSVRRRRKRGGWARWKAGADRWTQSALERVSPTHKLQLDLNRPDLDRPDMNRKRSPRLASRARGSKARPRPEAEFASPREGARTRSPAHIRIAVLTAVLMLTFYALLAAHQMMRATPAPDFAGIHLTDQARLAAARIDGRLAVVRAALTAGKAVAERPTARAADAADLAL